jgi:hypothetical protein
MYNNLILVFFRQVRQNLWIFISGEKNKRSSNLETLSNVLKKENIEH